VKQTVGLVGLVTDAEPYRERGDERGEGLHALAADGHQIVRAGSGERAQILRGRTINRVSKRSDDSLERGDSGLTHRRFVVVAASAEHGGKVDTGGGIRGGAGGGATARRPHVYSITRDVQ
jgi:hypothetical protein